MCDSQTNSAKKISVKIGVSANKNDLIVISISFLAFNFRGIIRRTSGKHSPLLFSFLNYAKIREALVECNGKKREVWRERISNSTDNENYFILSRWKIGREFHRWLPFFHPLSLFRHSISVLDHFFIFRSLKLSISAK